jgi:hypothetical protein
MTSVRRVIGLKPMTDVHLFAFDNWDAQAGQFCLTAVSKTVGRAASLPVSIKNVEIWASWQLTPRVKRDF